MFRRDLPLFGQAGGYTFKQAGPHCVQVEILRQDGVRLVSNKVEVLVRSESGAGRHARATAMLRTGRAAKLLYYAHDLEDCEGLNALHQGLREDTRGKLPSRALVEYLWAKAALRVKRELPGELRRATLRRLQSAEQHDLLGEHRRQRARELIQRCGLSPKPVARQRSARGGSRPR